MKEQDMKDKEVISGKNPQYLSVIRDQILYGDGKTLKERQKEKEEDLKKRIDE